MFRDLLNKKNITAYRLSKESGVPYATISDLCCGKTKIEKCAAETVYRIAKALGMTMEEIIEPHTHYRQSFDLFRSEVCHRVKGLGDLDFLIEMLNGNAAEDYYARGWYPEALYLVAMVDYLSRVNDIPLCDKYNSLRGSKLQKPLFPSSLRIEAKVLKDDSLLDKAIDNAIPEFARFNIIEGEVRDVC
ncbi:MAG: helix-turn-helix transcriptional regulator [Lachnospiraceae bacterium]|nr:helix-turn-helix transcriptional regulator [Lachnospiraceae bacterium]